jgi:hypothetical protein
MMTTMNMRAKRSSKRIRSIVIVAALVLVFAMPAGTASGFEPPADPQDKFTCPGGEPVPGHPGFPGIATGTEQSFMNTDGRAVAAWSAVFNNPTGTITLC